MDASDLIVAILLRGAAIECGCVRLLVRPRRILPESRRAQLRASRAAVVLLLKGLRGCAEDSRPTPVLTVNVAPPRPADLPEVSFSDLVEPAAILEFDGEFERQMTEQPACACHRASRLRESKQHRKETGVMKSTVVVQVIVLELLIPSHGVSL